ncbi:MAG TPA: sulfotransferase [Candidatus Margulisiibacteriota bacterium]|nr:sulfotransferase [Candidatus Margulisiibacteriota bacterium]
MRALDGAVLLDTARHDTGLGDFGDPSFRVGLDILTDALEGEAQLNDVGRMAYTGQILGYLQERLRIEDWHQRHPEIDAQVIEAPIFVTGLPRTGTTALSNLLAADPAARSLRFWESQRPTPPPEAATYHNDPRIVAADALLDGMKQAAPALAAMHDDTGRSPTEHQDLLGQHFRTLHFEGQAAIPSYVQWWLGCDMRPAYRHHQRVLKLLQWRCPPTRWNLKSPPDICHLDALTATYPDVRIVWTHRDPAKVLPSVCKLIAIIRSMCSDHVALHALGRHELALWSEAMRRGLAFRQQRGETAFADVFMDDLVARPIEAVAAVYARFGLPFTAEAEHGMRAWLAANPQHKHGAPHSTLEEFGLGLGEVRAAFREYTHHFDLRLEG